MALQNENMIRKHRFVVGAFLGALSFAALPFLHCTETPGMEAIFAKSRDHWAFQPMVKPLVPESKFSHPIDIFVDAQLKKKGLTFARPANRKTLIRRLYHDLIGLKPSFGKVQAFATDQNPKAYSNLINELLASPRFGEKWGRHWLDVARYADTKGYLAGGESRDYPYAYTYRDWVIRSLNQDLPFNQFITKQLAADFLTDSPQHPDLAALGFLTVGPRFLNRRQLIIDDRIDLVTRGLMGFTVACARCHDHFHDPIPTEDYYSLYGVFNASSQPDELPLLGSPDLSSSSYLAFKKKLDQLEVEVNNHIRSKLEYVKSVEGIQTYLKATLDGKKLNQNDFEALASKRKLYPKLANRWRGYLRAKERAKESFLKPLIQLANAKDSSKHLESWKQTDASTFPSFLRKRIESEDSVSLGKVILWYAESLAGAIQEAQTAEDKKGLISAVSHRDFPVNLAVEEMDKYFDTKDRNRKNSLRAKVAKHEATHPGAPPRAMSLIDKENIQDPQIMLRGNFGSRGPRVPRRFPVALLPKGKERTNFSQGSGRLELAGAILAPENPLTARVMVNRIWGHLFDQGLVRTPSDFGLMGAHPTHPELLDHLAIRFRNDGWSIKKIIRSIVLSKTYRQSSRPLPLQDPENRWLSSMNRKRLSFEMMRDSMLQVSGDLDLSMGGPAQKLHQEPFSRRRAVYGHVDRQNLSPTLTSFDFANPNIHAPKRLKTTVPQQALFALNHPFVIARAEKLANLALQHSSQNDPPNSSVESIRFFYQKLLSRDPLPKEISTAQSFLGPDAKLANLQDLGQAILMSNEFFFVD